MRIHPAEFLALAASVALLAAVAMTLFPGV